ncbi:AAA family ATPase [Candidatus Omnitrophota bacterium]
MDHEIRVINEKIKEEYPKIEMVLNELGKLVVGQKYLLERMIIGMLANGHILIEGVPGLAKTLAVKSLSQTINTAFQRIQFTPDLLPADLLGTLIFNQKEGDFTIKKGPLFSNIILADEINRAPSKVQSALLEAMQERQITIGENTFPLSEPFLVLATQNPIEQEGTYPLPEAQIDRFMLKVKITYPTRREERLILDTMTQPVLPTIQAVMQPEDVLRLRNLTTEIYVDEKIKEYILDIVFATRDPQKFKLVELSPLINYGASPRATLSLTTAAKAHAFIRGRGYVTPDDIKQIAYDVLRHRIIVSYEAEAEELTSEDIITKILDQIEVP